MAEKKTKEKVRKKAREKTSTSKSSAAFASKDNALFVGIDLGTSCASLSASNGVREVVPTG